MTYQLGARSRDRLKDVDARLVAVVERAINLTSQDFTVIEGRRTLARQRELYAQGRTRPGPIVTWTMKSKHIDGVAVDLCPWNGGIDWNDAAGFTEISRAMFAAAAELDTPIRWGRDWNQNGRPSEKGEADSPHFELVA